jgi:hypothetical protein
VTHAGVVATLLAVAMANRAGCDLYLGRVPLRARLAGASEDLARNAARCANCHGEDGRGVPEGGLGPSDIRPRTLRQAASRRGGPESRYDRNSFCTALREGSDPAGVVLARGMPRYRMSLRECGAIWAYLEGLESARE